MFVVKPLFLNENDELIPSECRSTRHFHIIGFIVGHEIGHGFDDTGSQYNEKGNLQNWWSKDDFEKFDTLKKRLIAQADHYELLPGKFGRGEIEICEIVADLSGAEIALRAYMNLDERLHIG